MKDPIESLQKDDDAPAFGDPAPHESSPNHAENSLRSEAIRIYERYAIEVVERFDLCPWAERARREGSVKPHVLLQESTEDLSASLDALSMLAEQSTLKIGLLLYPRLEVNRQDFEHFLRRLRASDSERYPIGGTPFAMAAFHPEAEPNLTNPERLVPFIRRTPDPTLQIVRRELLESPEGRRTAGTSFVDIWMMTRGGLGHEAVSVTEQIARKNLQTVQRIGPGALEEVFAAIALDRAASYARFRKVGALAGDTGDAPEVA